MRLTLQDKLALTMTSARSIGALAAAVGVSHRTMGRWLREGEPGGVKAIPDYARAAINIAFQVHKDITAAQARVDDIPYSAARPVYMTRPLMRNGMVGDRVVGERTAWIREDLRRQILHDQQLTRRYLAVSVRSVIDLRDYFDRAAADDIASGRSRARSARELSGRTARSFVERERRERGRVTDITRPFALHTRMANISPQRAPDDLRGIDDAEDQLRRKHEPAAQRDGTRVSDMYLFQLLPTRKQTTTTTATKTAKHGKKRT